MIFSFFEGVKAVQSLDILTINEDPKNQEDLVEIVWKAFDYFPEGIWKVVNYVGNIKVKHDLKIKSKERTYGAFIFSPLVSKIRGMRNTLKIEELLLAVTHDPVIITYHRFELDKFKRIVNLVHDYVSDDLGILSLFETEEEVGTKVAAHGLGHNQGLGHHLEPLDLMYMRLLNGDQIKIDGFCDECQRKLKKKKRDTDA